MKKLYIQKPLIIFMCLLADGIAVLGVVGAIVIDVSMLFLLAITFLCYIVAWVLSINKIFYNKDEISVKSIRKKISIKTSDVKEVFIEVGGYRRLPAFVINYERKLVGRANSIIEYGEKCRLENVKNTMVFSGVSLKDLEKFTSVISCDVQICSRASTQMIKK